MYFTLYVFILIIFIMFLYKRLQKKVENFENNVEFIDEENKEVDIKEKEPINYGIQANEIGVQISNQIIQNLQKSTVNIESGLKDKLKKYNQEWCEKYSKFYKFNEENKKHTEEYLYTNHDSVSGVYSPKLDKCVSEIDGYTDNINCEDHKLNCYDEYDMLIENVGRTENKYGNPICAFDKCKYTCEHKKTCYDSEKQEDGYVILEKQFKENCSLQQFNDEYKCNEKKSTSICPNKDGFETKLENDRCTYIDKSIITEEQINTKSVLLKNTANMIQVEEEKNNLFERTNGISNQNLEDSKIYSSSISYTKPLVEEEYIVKINNGATIITKES